MTEIVTRTTQGYRATERLYTASDMVTVVRDGDERAAFLLAAVGDDIPDRIFKRLIFPGSATAANETIDARTTRVVKPDKR